MISRLISLTISLSANPNMTDLLQRKHPQIEILAGMGVGYGKLSGKVTVGLASYWPCVTDFSGLSTYGLTA